MISLDRLEQAMRYLAETDEAYANARTEVERSTYFCKHQRAIRYEMIDPQAFKNVEDRKMAVERSQPVVDAEMKRIEWFGMAEKLKAKRETEALVVELWRTLESSRRAGL